MSQYDPRWHGPTQIAPVQPPPGGAPYPEAGRPGYEFTPAQNATMSSLARWVLILGVFSLLQALGALAGKERSFVSAGLSVAMGVLLILASNAFRKVVTTQGNDVGHLMAALTQFRTILVIRIVVFILTALVLVALLGLLFAGMMLVGARP